MGNGRRSIAWSIAATAILVSLALVAAGCGGSDESSSSDQVPLSKWVGDLCSSLSSWEDSLRSTRRELQQGGISESSLKAAADDVKRANDKLKGDLDGLGEPRIEAGEEAKQDVEDLSSQLSAGADEIKRAADDVSSDNVVDTTSSVVSTIAKMGQQVSTAHTDITNLDAAGEIKSAFEQAPSCQSLA